MHFKLDSTKAQNVLLWSHFMYISYWIVNVDGVEDAYNSTKRAQNIFHAFTDYIIMCIIIAFIRLIQKYFLWCWYWRTQQNEL